MSTPIYHAGQMPDVLDTQYFRATGLHLNLTGPGPWLLTGLDLEAASRKVQREITTVHEGAIDYVARRLLLSAYPGVKRWQASPAKIDETYRDSRRAAIRICQLLGVELHIARAIQDIAADDTLGHKFIHGPWEITGDDDEQTFRIRNTDGK